EDENIIIFNKPASLPCQPDEKHKNSTLSDMLKSYLIKKGEYNPESESSFSPALCNRLDTNTSGLVIGAKNAETLRDMNEQIRQRNVHKYYLCRLENIPKEKSAFVNAHIIKEETQNKSYIGDTGKEISMEYKVIEESGGTALCEVLLHTGRSHQIRAYFSSIGCPLVGDTKYGAKTRGGQALCSYRIRFGFPDEYDGVLSYLRDAQIKLEGIDI
ncbi:MAG: RNA pseudouridine synthase, partial [Clostridia bacterium]|nr:RNA pseudouridine synthase [Clostridia bacterium]